MRCAETCLAGVPRVNGHSQAQASALGAEFSWVICVPSWRAAGASASRWAGTSVCVRHNVRRCRGRCRKLCCS